MLIQGLVPLDIILDCGEMLPSLECNSGFNGNLNPCSRFRPVAVNYRTWAATRVR